jgi:hypothetical protein
VDHVADAMIKALTALDDDTHKGFSLATTHPITAAARTCLARLRVLPQKLGHALACRTRVRTPAHRPGALQPPCPYAMLVPSDVHKRIEGLLP